MTKRTVVLVEPRGDDTIEIKLSKAPRAIPGARLPIAFDCDPQKMPPWSQAGAIQNHGRIIFDKLGQHDAIKQAFSQLLGITNTEIGSLYFHLVADEAERLSWETLCDPKGQFLALDTRWPIGRMADSNVDPGIPPGDFVPPLKIMAILSAIRNPAAPEWAGIRDAVAGAIAKGFPIELTVLVGEQQLFDSIKQEGLAWVKVDTVPDRVTTLRNRLEEQRPHIVHIYSHGSVSSGISQLHLATIPDWNDDPAVRTAGSLIVKLDDLLGIAAVRDAWLVTLNCCEGGKAANDLHSMAHELVAGGLPAAIGMIEPVNAPDAHEFAKEFYPELLKNLGVAIAQAKATGKGVEFEWAPALHPPRTALRDSHGGIAEAHRAWTFPVLYVRPEPFAIRYLGTALPPPGPAPAAPGGVQPQAPPAKALDPVIKAQIETVAGALRTLPPDTPLEVRTELLAILQGLPPELLPSLDGTISAGPQLDDSNLLSINAWTGGIQPIGELAPNAGQWGTRQHLQDYEVQHLAAPPLKDARDWRDPDIGWGILLPDNAALSAAELAQAVDASAPIRKLLAARPGSPVFRWSPDVTRGFLRRYYADGARRDIALSGSDRGIGDQKLPWYMLIVGSPKEIPWDVHYLMNVSCFTGRLDLDEEGLSHYVDALITDWKGSAASSNRPVVWAVDHGQPDITWLMRNTIADPVAQKLRGDDQIKDQLTHLSKAAATTPALIQALTDHKPAFVLTTSHGLTGPLDDRERMASQLGFLVDDLGTSLTPQALLQSWEPDGAIWYAHACCSAGSDDSTSYKGLVGTGSPLEQTLEAIGSLGARVAPLPKALLGAPKPARAFIGQVEPTFNYTIRNPDNRQVLTSSLQRALYNQMFQKEPIPVGMALDQVYRHVGELFALWKDHRRDVVNGNADAEKAAMNAQLMAIDRQSMVILGDPTVALPRLV